MVLHETSKEEFEVRVERLIRQHKKDEQQFGIEWDMRRDETETFETVYFKSKVCCTIIKFGKDYDTITLEVLTLEDLDRLANMTV